MVPEKGRGRTKKREKKKKGDRLNSKSSTEGGVRTSGKNRKGH